MNESLQLGLMLLCAVILVVTVVHVVADRPIGRALTGLVALLEVGLLAALVVGAVAFAGTERDVSAVNFFGYLLACLALPPVGVWWARGEPSRGGTAVLIVVAFIVPFLLIRLSQIWGSGIGA